MRTEVVDAGTVDDAVHRILGELKEDTGTHVIYFDGWDGLAASAVVRAVGRRLTPAAVPARQRAPAAATGLEFSQIFHIDCSKWESRRAMQRMIAEQLKLPASVMEMFDAQDEEDAYQGIGKGSRTEIRQVAEEIYQEIQKLNRFLLIFHNGSSEEIDLDSLGFPLFGRYSRNKVLWTFQGRFRVYPRAKVDRALTNTRTTDVVLSAVYNGIEDEKLSDILQQEAEEAAHEMINVGGIDWRAAATNCFLYMMKFCRMGNLNIEYDLATHVCNYWLCDGVIQLMQGDASTDDDVDKLWLSADSLQREMQLDAGRYQNAYFPSLVERRLLKRMAYWTSPTYGFILTPDPDGQIPNGMFQQFDKLCVLKLSTCKFSFTSPPFICCHNLRFLWLDHCQDRGSTTATVNEEDIRRFVQRLWVLDVRHSNKPFLSKEMLHYMTQLRELNVVGEENWLSMDLVQSRLHNIHRLRIKETTVDSRFLFSVMDKMKLLELSRNNTISDWSKISLQSCRSLETVIINEFDDLIEISLMECFKLKNLLLSGSFSRLERIHIIGGRVETLDLSAMTTWNLYELRLLDCEKLCAILWPPAASKERARYLDKLRIDTIQTEGATAVVGVHTAGQPPSKFNWHISVSDARVLQSLESVKDYFGPNHAHVEISSPFHHSCADDAGSKDDGMKSSSGQHVQVKLKQLLKDTAIYGDIVVTLKDTNKQLKQGNEGDSDAPAVMCICPPPPHVPYKGCYIYIEDQTRAKLQTAITTLPSFICDSAKILHVHDSLHIASILESPLASATWNQLEWCRIERCPKLKCVFGPQLGGGGGEGSNNHTEMFKKLKTTWASHLPNARYIWNWSGTSSTSWMHDRTFEDQTLLHIDCCPRLVHVIHYPVVPQNAEDMLQLLSFIQQPSSVIKGGLESLEIMWCGELSVPFHFYDTTSGWIVSEVTSWCFLKLKHIRLHELPKLKNIINIHIKKIKMPNLETIKVRGCWSLRTLPNVASTRVVECDCEKEWWDKLEWESAEHHSQYKPTHP